MREELEPEKAASLSRVLFGIAGTFRRAQVSAKDVLDGITLSVQVQQHQDKRLQEWASCRGGLEKLLITQSVSLAAKVRQLKKECETAIAKAEKAKAEMESKFQLDAIITGEE